ncbi:hypothetical protein OHB41_51590 [Streptomyces sp. NBC_01571]|uniref:hypothetical protein n=1 Tax=Streptomyces sp. NBC_01571 TaxID=2975883 RepID=UPI002259DE6D|nr:hypothetical protein [Streptomyces sp. NBC_01571]MCX4581404.1 hypothetical protein [Streptomyces sp. NBC_01571]
MTGFATAQPGQVFTFTGAEDLFEAHYGIPVTALGEGENLLALGHLTDRRVLAATSAYHRRIWGSRVQPSRELDDLIHFGTRHLWIVPVRSASADTYGWEYTETDDGDSRAQPATVIDVEWLTREDATVQSECPACGKASRSTRSITGPGRAGWANYHRCRACDHQWPAVPASQVSLERRCSWPTSWEGSCFACSCLPDLPRTADCTTDLDPVIDQPLCSCCRAEHSPTVWQQLVAVAYGTALHTDAHDDSRDRWLYSEALRGITPAQAARTWTDRVAQTARRTARTDAVLKTGER